MSKQKIAWFAFVAVFVLPPRCYLVVNLYWWLFDGKVLSMGKMVAAVAVVLITGLAANIWAEEKDLLK